MNVNIENAEIIIRNVKHFDELFTLLDDFERRGIECTTGDRLQIKRSRQYCVDKRYTSDLKKTLAVARARSIANVYARARCEMILTICKEKERGTNYGEPVLLYSKNADGEKFYTDAMTAAEKHFVNASGLAEV